MRSFGNMREKKNLQKYSGVMINNLNLELTISKAIEIEICNII